MTKRTLYLIRHGQYENGDTPNNGGTLTLLGRNQAEITAAYLQAFDIDRVVASSLQRARETADIIAGTLSVEDVFTDALLAESVPTIPSYLARFFTEQMGYTPVDAERDRQRADAAFDTYFEAPPNGTNETCALVCHGNLIRYFITRVLQVPADTWARMMIYHCGISIVTIEGNGSMRLVTHNEIAHMPRSMQTEQ